MSAKYNDKYSHYEVRFARDKRYKLYDNGDLFDTVKDVSEKHAIAVGQQTGRRVLALHAKHSIHPVKGRMPIAER